MSQENDVYVPLSAVLDEEIWPVDAFGSLQGSFLDGIAYEGGDWTTDDADFTRSGLLALRVVNEQVFDLAFGLSLVFGGGPVRVSVLETLAGFQITIEGDVVSLRLPRNLFVPAVDDGGSFKPDDNPSHFVSVHLPVAVTVHENFEVTWGYPVREFEPRFSLQDLIDEAAGTDSDDVVPPEDETGVGGLTLVLEPNRFFIGDTGISVLIDKFGIRLNEDDRLPPEAFDAGLDTSFRGLFIGKAGIFLPPDLASALPKSLEVTNAFIGTGGFSGTVTLVETVNGSLAGADFIAKSLDVVIVQNSLTKFELKGSLKLPFFDNFVDVVVTVDLKGKISVRVSQDEGLIVLQKANVFKFTVDAIQLDIQKGLLTVHTSGTLTPLFQVADAHIDWPGIRIEDLSIDSKGNVHVAGGWIDLPNQVTLTLFGFTLEITRIGFGRTDDQRNWLGFNGALRIVDGVAAGASVEGLRILWDDQGNTDLTLEGVGVDLTIPGVFEMHGKVSLTGKEFTGAVLVSVPSVSLAMQGQFVTGVLDTGEKTYGVFLDLELPVGIPLGPTGLALYGFAGLYAHNREPNKQKAEGWYRNPDFSDGWYTKNPEGITDLAGKWKGSLGHMGFGAGVTFGTFADNGYTFNGRVLLVLVFPGPVILLEGMANLFRKRASFLTSEPLFHALMVIDTGKSITVGLDAHYKFRGGGELLDVHGSAEAFFDFVSPSNWHIYLGVKTPPERRLGARAFQMFDVFAFFMLTGDQLDVGAGWSYGKTWGFKHLNVSLSASMYGEAIVSWHPNHFTGSVGVSGSAGLHVFGIGLGVSVSATITGDVFQPFGLTGDFHVGIELPWPLPDIGVTLTLGWKKDLKSPPALPVPLREASIEHPKSRNTWALPHGKALISDDQNGKFDFEWPGDQHPATPTDVDPPFSSDVPRVPADTKVGLTFTRPIDDPSLIGNTNSAAVEADRIGVPNKSGKNAYTVQYTLVSLELQKWAPAKVSNAAGGFEWVTIKTAGPDNTTTSSDRLVGAWQPGVEQPSKGHSEQNKLLVNATTPFDYVADRSQSWTTWFAGANPGYPCPLVDPNLSAHFTQEIGTDITADEFQFDAPDFFISWAYGGEILQNEAVVNSVLGAAFGTIDRGLNLFESSLVATIIPPSGATEVLLSIGTPAVLPDEASPFRNFGLQAPNPMVLDTATIRTFDGLGSSRTLRASNAVANGALILGDWVEIEPAFSAVYVEVEIAASALSETPYEVVVIRPDGTEGTPQSVGLGDTVIRVHQPIGMVVIRRNPAAVNVEAALIRFNLRSPVTATAFFDAGPPSDFVEANGVIQIAGPGINKIQLFSNQLEFLLLEMALPSRMEVIAKATQDSLSLLTREDPLFEPETAHRLVITARRKDTPANDSPFPTVLDRKNTFVDHAYFHVVGPPGVGTPELPPPTQPPQTQPGPSGFEDLRAYVEQTVPPTIPAEGEKLLLPRAFYRAYDVAAKFNEAYVELLYLRAKRDLTVRLFDGDNPVLRPDGRVAIPTPSWERSRQQTVKEWVALWIAMVNGGACRPDDFPPFLAGQVAQPQVLSGQDDVLLAPETLHQARLVPALLHETFLESLPDLAADGVNHHLERWTADNAGPITHWEVQSEIIPGQVLPDGSPAKVFFVTETTLGASSLTYEGSFGAAGGPDAPGQWSDVRARVLLRWTAGLIGFEVRRASANDLIRVTLDRTTGARSLVAVSGGTSTTLASDTTTFPDAATDVEIVIECTGDRVRVFQDGDGVTATPIFDVTGAPTSVGTVGLYVSVTTAPRFTEIRVDDLRPAPSAAFVFDFVTSKFANFFHHAHSYDDHLFDGAPASSLTAANLSGIVGKSIALAGTGTGNPADDGLGDVSDDERRAYEAMEAIALGPGPLHDPEHIEITRVSGTGAPLALLLRSPEPLLWGRVVVSAAAASQPTTLDVAGNPMLAAMTFGATPADESVTILIREATSLSAHRVDWRPLPTASNPAPDWTPYFTFGFEPVLSDGKQVRILAVDAGQTPPAPAGVTLRFAADSAAVAAVHFTSPGVELRLVAPDGTVVHRRPFFTPDSFTPFPMRAVRKLDGTGILLFVDPSSGIAAPPTLRLRLTFARAAGDEDLRMRQDGDETSEVADLDVVLSPVP